MTTKEGKIKDGKTIESISKIAMDNLVNLNITKIVIFEIMEVGKEGIRTIFVVKKRGIKGMIVQFGKKN